jgi:hypothetical protein
MEQPDSGLRGDRVVGDTTDARSRDQESQNVLGGIPDDGPRDQEKPSSRMCECQISDPVMQADMRFHCHRCGFLYPAVICDRCKSSIVAAGTADVARLREQELVNIIKELLECSEIPSECTYGNSIAEILNDMSRDGVHPLVNRALAAIQGSAPQTPHEG